MTTARTDHDLIVLGGGAGAAEAALAGAAAGLATVCVWPDEPGAAAPGARCLDTVLLSGAAAAAWSGLRPCDPDLEDTLRTAGVELHRCRARLDGPGRVLLAGGRPLTAAHIVIATGSRPAGLPGTPVDGERIVAPATAAGWAAPEGPILVAGAGPEGAAIAAALADRGSEVVLAEIAARILPGFAAPLGAEVDQRLRAQGVDVRCRTRVRQARVRTDGVAAVLAGIDDGSREPWFGPRIVAARGWRPATARLGLETVAAVRDRSGRIQVDSSLQTAEPGLYAVGDVTPTASWPGVAALEAAVAIAHITGGAPPPVRTLRLPVIAPTKPPLVAVGHDTEAAGTAGHLVRRVDERSADHLAVTVIDAEQERVLGRHLAGDEAGSVARRIGALVDAPAAGATPLVELGDGLLRGADNLLRSGDRTP